MRLLRWTVASALVVSVMTAGGATNEACVLASGGQSKYVIVISAARPRQIVTAANDLQKYLRGISGATLEIVDDNAPMPARAILLGRSEGLEALGIDRDTDELGTSGYIVRTVSGDAALFPRVREARMPVMYARLVLKVGTKAERRRIADEFFALTDELGIVKLDQWSATVRAFRRSVY